MALPKTKTTAISLALLLGASPAAGQDDEPEPSARCRRVHATAESQAYLLGSPTLWVEGVHVPQVGDETGMGLIVGGEYQLRASMSWSPIDLARAVLLLEQANVECRQMDAASRVRRILELGDGIGELEARRAEREVLVAAAGEIDATVAHARAQVVAGVGTQSELVGLESEALRLARRRAQLDAEIARLMDAGFDTIDPSTLDEDLAAYEANAIELEDQRSSFRRLAPWSVAVRGGIVPGDRIDWFGQIQVGVNLGIFAHHLAEDAAVGARREELLDDADELRGHISRLAARLRASLPALREELGHVERLIALQRDQRERLAGTESSEVDHMVALTDLLLMGLASERAHLATLIEAREGVLETDLHADE